MKHKLATNFQAAWASHTAMVYRSTNDGMKPRLNMRLILCNCSFHLNSSIFNRRCKYTKHEPNSKILGILPRARICARKITN